MDTREGCERIAIIGCGYVGLSLGERLLREGGGSRGRREVIGTTTTPGRVREIRAAGLQAEILELAEEGRVRDLLRGCRAAYLLVAPGSRSRGYREVYLEGLEHFLRAVGDTGVERVIYTSSSSVYGQDDGSWVDETSPLEPRAEGGKTLLEAERTLLRGAGERGLSATVLRLSGIHGPGRGPQNFLDRVAGQERADGDAYLNLVHRHDIVTALEALLRIPHAGVLNLNDDHPIPRREYYDRLLADAGLPPIRWVAADGPPSLGKRVRNTLAKKTLGLTLRYPWH